MIPIIQTNQLSVGYKKGRQTRAVISNLGISVNKGELIGIIGKNGIGKSTLLKTIARLLDPLVGDVMLYGKSIDSYDRNEFAQKVSFVSTEILKLNHCTVRQLVSFGRAPYTNWIGKLLPADVQIVSEAIEMVGIFALAERYINEISDGERQRVMIARTLAQDTDIIILDEPTAFLDMPNKYEVIHLLHELTRNRNKTILYTSHDLNIAIRESDRLWLITGEEFLDGAPEDLVLQHAISNLFDETRLNFDLRNGEFSIQRKPIGSCKLSGTGLALTWTCKALERLGFNINNENYLFEIQVIENNGLPSWHFIQEDNIRIFGSIYELAGVLKG